MLTFLIVGAVLFVPGLVVLHLTGFWRAFPLILLLGGLSFYAYDIVGRTHDHSTAVLAACLVPAAIVAFGLWRPASSKFALWVADGVTGAAICAKWLGLGASVVTFAMASFDVLLWLRMFWWLAAIALVGWGVERVMMRHVKSSLEKEPGALQRMIWLHELDGR